VPARTRFQVDLAHPVSVVRKYVIPEQVPSLEPIYERDLLGEVAKLAAVIPHDQLAIQWDVASGVFSHLEWDRPTRFGKDREEMLQFFSAWCIRLSQPVPKDVELVFHLCYGDFNHKHSVEPTNLAMCVAFANRVSAGINRPIALFHMPVPRNRSDDAYFAPLKDLKLQPGTRVALGLVHATDGVEGTNRRIATAKKYLGDFLISTECGFGRRPAGTIPELLRIHAKVAGIA
jgi:methionine synthase II (cobalamin-independent)